MQFDLASARGAATGLALPEDAQMKSLAHRGCDASPCKKQVAQKKPRLPFGNRGIFLAEADRVT
jgi:hypothetical protein